MSDQNALLDRQPIRNDEAAFVAAWTYLSHRLRTHRPQNFKGGLCTGVASHNHVEGISRSQPAGRAMNDLIQSGLVARRQGLLRIVDWLAGDQLPRIC